MFASSATAKKAGKDSSAKTEKTAKSKNEKPKSVKKVKFDQAGYDAAYAKGDYETCASMLFGKGDEKNLVKDLLDADMLVYLTKNYSEAGKAFLETYGKMQQASSEMTGGKALGAALGGENAVKYSGAEYERYLAWSMRLSSALASGQNDVANGIMKDYVGTFMDEIQALRALNEELANGSESALESDDFKNAEAALKKAGVDLGISKMTSGKPAKSAEKYDNSRFFNYLGTVAYAASGDFDHAAEFASTYKVSDGFVKEVVNVPSGKGRLEVVAFSGTIGKRSEHENKNAVSVAGANIYTKIVYPEFIPNAHEISKVRVTLSDGTNKNASQVENFDKAVRIDVAQKARGAYSRSVFRNVVKNSASVAAIIAANQGLEKAGSNPLAAKAAQIAVDKAVDAAVSAIVDTEKADVRQGVYFPHMAHAAGFSCAPGTYTVKIEYLNDKGSVVDEKTIENVVVESGKVQVAVSACER